jgi:bifunctional DNA-binding transcriptional regulator/antitoxin component of YhaV-PrlF toxin-antitoxin module
MLGGCSLTTETAENDIPFFAEVTAGGRITIPEEIRKIFEIKDGDAVFCRLKIMPNKRKNNSPVKESKQTA